MEKKIIRFSNLGRICSRLRAKGKTIVTTNGVFDILHPGHVRYLKSAKKLGDVLIVGINSDLSVKKLKGSARPLVGEAQRAEIVSSLQSVDLVCIFDGKTPYEFIRMARPNWHVKGGDYSANDLPEKDLVEELGGKVKILDFEENYSTTNLINKILKAYSQ
jgi:rfaE bifunctional protein nucleotidyltransferase chain/domain